MAGNTNYDLKLFTSLLVPSLLSGFAIVLASLSIVGAIAVLTNYRGSDLQIQIQISKDRAENQALSDLYNTSQGDAVSDDYQVITEDFAQNKIIDRAPVMVFWMFVGALVYFMVTGIMGAVSEAAEISEELHFIHARRKELLRNVYIKTAIRFGVLAVWTGFIWLFFKILLPYCLAAAHVGAGNITTALGVGYCLLAFIILVASLHVHVVMLRLVALRPRLFSEEVAF